MQKLFIKIFLALCLSITVSLNAQQTDQVGTSMANFLKIGVGPRAIGMGDAFVALANDVSALYWNPAGIAQLNKNEILFQTTNYVADTKLHFLGVAMPMGDMGTLGASFYNFSSGDMEETTLRQPEGTGRTFSASNLAIGLSYARTLTDHFSVGVSVKYISETLSSESASAFAFDIGSIFTTSILNNMNIGFTLSNLGSTMQLDGPDLQVGYDVNPDVPTNKEVDAKLGTQSWELPLTFRVGLGTYALDNENYSLLVEADANDTRDYQLRYNMGGEFNFKLGDEQKLSVRAGYKGEYDEEGITFGAGLFLTLSNYNFKFDYAFADVVRLGNVHRYSLSILF